MKWYEKPSTEKRWPRINDRKIITKFLWWPKRIGIETHWLETASWEMIYAEEIRLCGGGLLPLFWVDDWIDNCWK